MSNKKNKLDLTKNRKATSVILCLNYVTFVLVPAWKRYFKLNAKSFLVLIFYGNWYFPFCSYNLNYNAAFVIKTQLKALRTFQKRSPVKPRSNFNRAFFSSPLERFSLKI